MANFSHSDSRRLYSWWWDSHIGPKNSKWLQENITDMDRKVKTMIKLIEEDADSFAKRAEMYYKKRPELMRLVEDFYRAYRALAERYDHATGALRQAHRTIGEAFPNQDPFVLAEDSQSGTCGSEVEPRTPEPPHPVRAMFDPDDLHKDALGHSSSHFHAIKRNGAHSNESDSAISNKGLKQLNELFGSEEGAPQYVKFAEKRITKGLDHHVGDGNDSKHEMRTGHGNQSSHMMNDELKTPIKSSSERAFGVETEIQTLKDSLAKFEAEKQAGLIQYQHALERLSKLEDDVSRAQEDAKGLNERACKAESEVQTFKEALMKLQAEKEAGLLKYHQCVERMSILEDRISNVQEDTERAIKAETELQSLKQALARVEAEKEASLLQYNQCLEKMSNLEAKVLLAEENARNLSERAVRAETEVQFLKEAIAKLDEEKEAASLQYQRSLEMISTLQGEVSHAQEVARRLSSVIVMGVAKLNSTEEQYLQLERENQSLQEEVDTLVEMMTLQKQEFSEKHEELEKLQLCIDEECSRSMEAEAALHFLQNLHSEWQEEREALVLEVQNGVQRLKDKELEYNALEEESCFVKEENKILNEQNISMSITEKNLQLEIVRLKEAQVKLDKEIEVLVNQRDALQQQIYCLKEELDELKRRHLNVYEQMEQVGLNPDTFISSVKSFQDENSRLKEIHHKDNNEKESLMEKLKNMENLFEKNALLENSLLDVNAGFALLREKVKTLEETCQSLERVNSAVVDEKESLLSLLMVSNRNVEKLSEKETFLVEFLFDANIERAWLREKSKSLEEFCESLDNEKHGIFIANNNLISEFKSMQQKLDDLGMKHTTLEESHSCLEKEMEFKIHQLEELQATLSFEREERATFEDKTGTQLVHLEHSNRILQEEGNQRMKEFEDERFEVVKMCLEVFILQRFILDMEEKSISLFTEYQKLLEASRLSDNLVMNLERENFEQQVKVSSLLEQLEKLRSGIRQMAFSLKIEPASSCQAKIEEEQLLLEQAMRKNEDLETSLWLAEDEKHQMLLEKSVFLTLLGQLKLETASIEVEKTSLDRHLKLRTEDLFQVQAERNELRSSNDRLNHQIGIGKDILSEKESELLEAEQKVKAMECENMELKRKLIDGNSECDEARLTRDVLEKQILSISESITHKNKEIECFQKVTGNLELDLSRLHEEIKQQSVEKDKLSSELQHKRNEIKLWEYETETLYSDCQVTNICATVFEDKVHELGKAYESVEDDRDSKEEDIERLKERLSLLELENQEAKSELAAYLPVLASLRNSITSLEGCVIPQSKNIRADNPDTEVADLPNQHDKNKELPETQSLTVGNGVSDLLELQARIEKIESSVVEQKRLIMQSVNKNIQLLHSSKSNSSEVGNEVLVKDIPLDQVSQCSSYDHGFVPNGMSKREDSERIEEVHEPWGIVEQDRDHDLPFDQGKKLSAVPGWEKLDFFEIEQVEKKSEYPSSEIQSEEMSVVSLPQEGNKRKILERLASDAQKLTNLQLTVQDLNKKVEQLERHKKPKDAEFITAKEQLKEVEEAIMQLVDSNRNLSKKAEGHTSGASADGKLTLDTEEAGKERISRISERARRASEKIGRLQLEVQGIQFVLLKVEDRYRAKLGDRKVLLMDYLYGQSRSSTTSKRKKRPFFSCVKPPSRSD